MGLSLVRSFLRALVFWIALASVQYSLSYPRGGKEMYALELQILFSSFEKLVNDTDEESRSLESHGQKEGVWSNHSVGQWQSPNESLRHAELQRLGQHASGALSKQEKRNVAKRKETTPEIVARTCQKASPRVCPRAFVCITGQLERLLLEIKIDAVLKPLTRAGYVVDVALVVSDGTARYTNPQSEMINQTARHTPEWSSFEQANTFLQDYGYQTLVASPTSTGERCSVPEIYRFQLNKFRRALDKEERSRRAENHARQFEMMSKCSEAMVNATAAASPNTTTPYDLILRLRDDVAPRPPLSVARLLHVLSSSNNTNTIVTSDCRNWRGMNDRFAAVTPDIAFSYFNAPHQRFVRTRDDPELLPGIDNPETFLWDTYTKLNITSVASSALRRILKYQRDADGFIHVPEDEEKHARCPRIAGRPRIHPDLGVPASAETVARHNRILARWGGPSLSA